MSIWVAVLFWWLWLITEIYRYFCRLLNLGRIFSFRLRVVFFLPISKLKIESCWLDFVFLCWISSDLFLCQSRSWLFCLLLFHLVFLFSCWCYISNIFALPIFQFHIESTRYKGRLVIFFSILTLDIFSIFVVADHWLWFLFWNFLFVSSELHHSWSYVGSLFIFGLFNSLSRLIFIHYWWQFVFFKTFIFVSFKHERFIFLIFYLLFVLKLCKILNWSFAVVWFQRGSRFLFLPYSFLFPFNFLCSVWLFFFIFLFLEKNWFIEVVIILMSCFQCLSCSLRNNFIHIFYWLIFFGPFRVSENIFFIIFALFVRC